MISVDEAVENLSHVKMYSILKISPFWKARGKSWPRIFILD